MYPLSVLFCADLYTKLSPVHQQTHTHSPIPFCKLNNLTPDLGFRDQRGSHNPAGYPLLRAAPLLDPPTSEVLIPGHIHTPQTVIYPSGLIKACSKHRQLDS